jgi:hypothetical protein
MASAQTVTVPTTYSGLIGTGSTGVTIGDKTFYDFTLTGDIAASNITVVQAPGADIGLEFQANWSSNNGNNMDTLIRYKVHVNSTTQKIASVGLNFDGTSTGTNLGINAGVTETVSDLMGNQLGQISVFDAGPSNSALNRDSASFTLASPSTDLWLSKDISVHSLVNQQEIPSALTKLAAVAPDTATISFVDNTFHQTIGTASVPVPPAALMALTTLGLGAFAPIRRRVFGR